MIVARGLFGALIGVAAAQRRGRFLVACCVAAMSLSVGSAVQAQQKASVETVARMLKLLEGSGYHYTKVTDSAWSITFKGTKKESVEVLAIAEGDDLLVVSVIADRVELDDNAAALRALLKGNGNLPDGVSVLLDGDDDYIVQTRNSLKQMNAAVANALNLWANQAAHPIAAHQATPQDPAEFTGPPKPIPAKPSPVLMRFAQNDALRGMNKDKPETIKPALEALDAFVKQAPNEPSIRWMRAGVLCETGAPPKPILDDLIAAQAQVTTPAARQFVHVQSILALKAKMEFAIGEYEDAMRDLDAAIREDYDSGMEVFNDGDVEPSLEAKPCAWTIPDLEQLAKRFPDDHRPPLYQGLYTSLYLRFKEDADYSLVIEAYERAAQLNPKSPLPHYYLGMLQAFGSIGGLFSMANAKCIEDIEPRSEACLQLDEIRKQALRFFTRAIAADPTFEPAYALRAALLLRLKEYRQAIRDYNQALALKPNRESTRIIFNDRALAKLQSADYQGAILDLDKAIAIGCESGCGSYENRAEAHLKLGNYTAALADLGASIKQVLTSAIYLMNIDSFRKLYPEFDDLPDDVICEKMRALFFPEMSYASFSRQFLIKAHLEATFVLSDLYLKRGDIYAKLGRMPNTTASSACSRHSTSWRSRLRTAGASG